MKHSIVLWGYLVIAGLTWILIAMNVRSLLRQYVKEPIRSRLYANLGTLLILGAVIMGVAYNVVDRVIDSEEKLRQMNNEEAGSYRLHR